MQDISSNFDNSCMCIASKNRIVITSIRNNKVLFKQQFKDIQIKFARMYMLSNILFIVKEGSKSISVYKIEDTFDKVDDIELNSPIQDIKILAKNMHVLVGTEQMIESKGQIKRILKNPKIYVIDIQTFELTQTINIDYFEDFHFDIPKNNEFYLAYNQPSSGIIILRDLEKKEDREINMHKNENYVQIFAFNSTGEYLASLSKGTILKVIQTKQESYSRKFWLNNSKVSFCSVAFSYDQQFLAACEDSGKIHLIYWNDNKQEQNQKTSTRSTFMGFFNKEQAFDQFDKGLKHAQIMFEQKNGHLVSFNKQEGIVKYLVSQKTSQNQELSNNSFIDLGFPDKQIFLTIQFEMKIRLSFYFLLATIFLKYNNLPLGNTFNNEQPTLAQQSQTLIDQKQQNSLQKYNWTKEDEMFAFGEMPNNTIQQGLARKNRKLGEDNKLESISKQLKALNKKLNKKHKKKKHVKKNKKHAKKHKKKHIVRKERLLRQVSNDNKIIVKYEKMTKREIQKQKRLQKKRAAHRGRLLAAQKLHPRKKI